MNSFEVNFDGIVGPTHNYAGLSYGNVASDRHGGKSSSPRQAALQGLDKMWALQELGLKQAVLPPHERPHIPTLRRLGFSGNEQQIIASAAKNAPHLLAIASSASSMWVANAATVSPSADTKDGMIHFTPANLLSMFHRSIEPAFTSRLLRTIFSGSEFVHHAALPAHAQFADEGAANHTRFCSEYGEKGVELFVHGDSYGAPGPSKFPARQTRQSVEALIRSHGLDPTSTIVAQQHPDAIDAGVFHNDVISVGNRNVFLLHEKAFTENQRVCAEIATAMGDSPMHFIEVAETEVPLEAAVSSYLFNSQLVTPEGMTGTSIVVPVECGEQREVKTFLDKLEAEHSAIDKVRYFDLRQSMNNGGGPACLRLRVVLNEMQCDSLGARVMLDHTLYEDLQQWINTHYREELKPEDIADPALLEESRSALDALCSILRLGSIYEFQRN